MIAETRWLVVGHGSVGSFLAERLAGAGAAVSVLDPRPRLPIRNGSEVRKLAADAYDYAVSCVPPGVAGEIPQLVGDALRRDGLYFDWNTVAPSAKLRIADAAPAPTVDVALLDSVDGAGLHPRLAISGPESARAAALLEEGAFQVSIAGDQVGQAAALKYLRSIFMKTLEALVIEFSALATGLDEEGIIRSSIENNLGEQFGSFMDLLVATNRIHAGRRGSELADAVAMFASEGNRPELAASAVGVLRQAAEAWTDGDAPAADAKLGSLAHHLRKALWPQPAQT
jgi:3-hydroxyisobutyrate dehydrogenase-like beta-hydroxyacid dehydrogenase